MDGAALAGASQLYRGAIPGVDLRDRPPASRVRLQGSDTPSHIGNQLQTGPSLRQVVRAMATASRCKYERMKMEGSANQFVTRQLIERAPGADGCGPPSNHGSANATIDEISRRAIFGD